MIISLCYDILIQPRWIVVPTRSIPWVWEEFLQVIKSKSSEEFLQVIKSKATTAHLWQALTIFNISNPLSYEILGWYGLFWQLILCWFINAFWRLNIDELTDKSSLFSYPSNGVSYITNINDLNTDGSCGINNCHFLLFQLSLAETNVKYEAHFTTTTIVQSYQTSETFICQSLLCVIVVYWQYLAIFYGNEPSLSQH